MNPLVSALIRVGRLLLGAVIIITGTFGLFINLHDFLFLVLNIAFLAVGLYLFLDPVASKNAAQQRSY